MPLRIFDREAGYQPFINLRKRNSVKLDQKYFNKFLLGCAALTMAVIIYSTVRYTDTQQREFFENIESLTLQELPLNGFFDGDPVDLSGGNAPSVVHFWSTWSGMSMDVNERLYNLQRRHFPELTVYAAVVRDGEETVREYTDANAFNFRYVQGTELFQELKATGVPTLLFFNRDGSLADFQIGRDLEAIEQKTRALMELGAGW
ncbi:MAG: TlpA family protein disulfide reductase [Balneolaceae bacterium]